MIRFEISNSANQTLISLTLPVPSAANTAAGARKDKAAAGMANFAGDDSFFIACGQKASVEFPKINQNNSHHCASDNAGRHARGEGGNASNESQDGKDEQLHSC